MRKPPWPTSVLVRLPWRILVPSHPSTIPGMPANITPAANPVLPVQLTVPADFDPNNAAGVNVPFQATLDGLAAARNGLYGASARRSYRCLDGTNVTIDALGYVVLTDAVGGAWYAVPHLTPTTLTATALVGAAPAINTLYYIYARRVLGSIGFVATLTGPDPTFSYENGTTTRAFVGRFMTDGAGMVIPVQDNTGAAGAGLYSSANVSAGTILSAAEARASATPGAGQSVDPGVIYADTTIRGWALVSGGTGNLIRGANIASSTRVVAGEYDVVIQSGVPAGQRVGGFASQNQVGQPYVISTLGPLATIKVFTTDATGVQVDSTFFLILVGG